MHPTGFEPARFSPLAFKANAYTIPPQVLSAQSRTRTCDILFVGEALYQSELSELMLPILELNQALPVYKTGVLPQHLWALVPLRGFEPLRFRIGF